MEEANQNSEEIEGFSIKGGYHLKIGDIELLSVSEDCNRLAGIARALFMDKKIREYLSTTRVEKKINKMVG